VTRLAIVLSVLGLSLCAASPAEAARTEFFGIAQARGLDVQDLQRMVDSRVRTYRFLLQWRTVSPSQGTFHWGPTDRFVGGLASHGIQPVPFVWGSPPWVAASPARPPLDSPQDVQAWRDFLKAAVARYGPGGTYWATGYRQQYGEGATPLPVQSWQIWNEPNLQKYFDPGGASGHGINKYAQLVKISHDAIKSEDPQARIVLAGLLSSPGRAGALKAWDFLSGLYKVPGFKNDFDAAALHPYTHSLYLLRDQLQLFRAVMRKHGDQGTPLWITELGWGSAPPDRFGINKGLTGQAQMLSGSFGMILRHRSAWNVQRLFWFLWRDPPASQGTGGCSFCGSAGLLRYDRTPKPAYSRFRGFTAETTPPQASITAGPSAKSFTKDSTPSFSLASNEPGSTFECRIDARAFERCGSPYTAPLLSDGPHAFFVKAIDAPGNESPVVARSFTVDTVAPAVTISSGPVEGAISSDPSPSFGFASNDPGAALSCQLDGGGFQSCNSPFSASGLADGPHTFHVKATDRAQNTAVASRTWTVAGPADVSITAGPQNGELTNDATPSFSFSSLDSDSDFSCRIDGAPFASCSSPLTTSRLSDSHHTFIVKATDTAQTTDLAWRHFTVEATAPSVTINGPRKVMTKRRKASATFTLRASERVDRRCRVDSRRFKSCSWRYRTPRLRRGAHTLKVKATDRIGNVGTKRKRFRIARK
jgi:hypothetical protein